MIYTSISIDFDLLNAMEPSILSKNDSLTSKGHPEGQILLKWCILILYGPKKSKKIIEHKFYYYVINLEALLI